MKCLCSYVLALATLSRYSKYIAADTGTSCPQVSLRSLLKENTLNKSPAS